MLFKFSPAWKNVSQSFLQNIFGILHIKANCSCGSNKLTLFFLDPRGEFFFVFAGHGINFNGLLAKMTF